MNILKYLKFFFNVKTTSKPKEILRLEKIYKITIEEHTEGHINSIDNNNRYLLDINRNVIGLNLRRNKINKIQGFESFTELINLILDENQITKIEGLGKLTKLRFISLDSNNIEKIEGLDSNINLNEITLFNNKIKKIENLQNLRKLKVLYLFNNEITKIEGLDDLRNLEELYLSDNQICKLEGLENLVSLKELWMSNNKISKIDCLENQSQLTKLYLGHNYISKIENLNNLISLNSLDLSSNKIKQIQILPSLKNLVNFEIRDNLIEKYSKILNENKTGKFVVRKIVYLHSGESYYVDEGELGLMVGRFDTIEKALDGRTKADTLSIINLAGKNVVDFIYGCDNYDEVFLSLQDYYKSEFGIELINQYYFNFPDEISYEQAKTFNELLPITFHEINNCLEFEDLDVEKFNEERDDSNEF
ncbi:leucine-rich repeat protein [Flavobacterium sp. XS1P32]|uniref:leucine-rich repeat protein n=1 Tax=Flavobacterium sp. XS1P32 TaxID=3401726 RepID=UPI003AAC3957